MSLSSIIGRKMQSKKMSAGMPLRSSRKKKEANKTKMGNDKDSEGGG